MALKLSLARSLFLSKSISQFLALCNRLLFSRSSPLPPFSCYSGADTPNPVRPFFRPTTPFCTSPEPKRPNPKLVNFSPSDSVSDSETAPLSTAHPGKPKLPPPYNPFSNEPAVNEPDDPKDLAEVFAKIREDGLMNSAVKMFDGLSQDGLTHEALELFARIKDRAEMPDVIAHTAVLEAYVDAGQGKVAHKVFLRMLASGVLPNAYSYKVVIRGLVESGGVEEAKKYVLEMTGKGMRPNAGTCVAVYEALLTAGLESEGVEMLQMLKDRGAVPEEEKVKNVVKNKRGSVARTVMNVLYGK